MKTDARTAIRMARGVSLAVPTHSGESLAVLEDVGFWGGGWDITHQHPPAPDPRDVPTAGL